MTTIAAHVGSPFGFNKVGTWLWELLDDFTFYLPFEAVLVMNIHRINRFQIGQSTTTIGYFFLNLVWWSIDGSVVHNFLPISWHAGEGASRSCVVCRASSVIYWPCLPLIAFLQSALAILYSLFDKSIKLRKQSAGTVLFKVKVFGELFKSSEMYSRPPLLKTVCVMLSFANLLLRWLMTVGYSLSSNSWTSKTSMYSQRLVNMACETGWRCRWKLWSRRILEYCVRWVAQTHVLDFRSNVRPKYMLSCTSYSFLDSLVSCMNQITDLTA